MLKHKLQLYINISLRLKALSHQLRPGFVLVSFNFTSLGFAFVVYDTFTFSTITLKILCYNYIIPVKRCKECMIIKLGIKLKNATNL